MRVKPDKKKNQKRTKITKFDINWDAKYSELLLFRERFGHCNVPQYWSENKSLGGWVIRQRSYQVYLRNQNIFSYWTVSGLFGKSKIVKLSSTLSERNDSPQEASRPFDVSLFKKYNA